MKISQPTYSVRDASEIAFGLLVLSIILFPVAMGMGFFISTGVAALWPAAEPPPAIFPACSLLLWLGAMWLIVRRYQRIAASWPEQRRGKGLINLVEWIVIGINLLISYAAHDGPDEAMIILRLFFSGLMFLLLLSHVATYALLRYRPRANEIIVWAALAISLVREMTKHN